MPDDFDIKDFLLENRKEVEGMLDTEYNEEEVLSAFQRDVDEEKKRADVAEAELGETKAELGETKAELGETKTKLGELTTKMDEMTAQLREAMAEIARLKAAK